MNIVIDNAVFNYQKIFADFGNITAMAGRDITAKIVKNADVLIIRSRTKVDKFLLQNSNIKFIGSCVAGTDHIDIKYLKNKQITLATASGCNANAVAEYVISALLNLAKKNNFKLNTKTLAIIGVGNVGSAVAKKAHKLGLKLLLNDPVRQQQEKLTNFVNLTQALNADIISFHTPLTKNGIYPSYKLLNADNFHLLKPKAIIINTARGGVIDENTWQQQTTTNIIDCWQNEPNINNKLLNTAYLATPHIAGHSIDAKFMGSYMIYKKLAKFLYKKPIKHTILFSNKSYKGLELLPAINKIYNFTNDDKALRYGNFENYRINYPLRHEWYHYNIEL